MAIWRGADIAQLFDVEDMGATAEGAYCLKTPQGPATPLVYRGEIALLEYLGQQLPTISGQTGYLSLSHLLKTAQGDCYAKFNNEYIILATIESGPVCDPHNAFELLAVCSGLAHVHKFLPVPAGAPPSWPAHYASQKDRLQKTAPGVLSRRARMAWTLLEETWHFCIEETLARLDSLKQDIDPCLTLGLAGFGDFIYVADRHRVHYNNIANCRLDSPMVDMASLLLSAAGDPLLVRHMLTAYQRLRPISGVESKQLLAHLWFPAEIRLEGIDSWELADIERENKKLQEKIMVITAVEEILMDFEPMVTIPVVSEDDREIEAIVPEQVEILTDDEGGKSIWPKTVVDKTMKWAPFPHPFYKKGAVPRSKDEQERPENH